MKSTIAFANTGDRAGNRILARGSSTSAYSIRLATTRQEIREAQTMRFLVFNVELGEGLESSYETLRDEDPFDAVCDHLIVQHVPTREIVGTYRLQTGAMAATNRGFYSDAEFDLTPFAGFADEIVELGRACVASPHRNMAVLGLLWRGIIDYAIGKGCRYLMGCSSITSTNPADGAAAYSQLSRRYLVAPHLRTTPRSAYVCDMHRVADPGPTLPKLLRAYLAMGARICGAPALDREFKTIDFLTLHDLQQFQTRETGKSE